ncbi:hypothetical protein RIF29_26655 [Crotalaria pallida]|uniref:Reverse transcriptase zinc-binding domain-containing protein n=1 Tax=Crotalaria pallida TaxID=3830 RepID=A0AAN9ENJ3_CROPI
MENYGLLNGGIGASNGGSDLMWKALWSLKVHEKVKIFWWRVLHNILPTKDNLLRKKLDIQPGCSRCEEGIETSFHCFWDCCFAKKGRWKSDQEVVFECNKMWQDWKKVSTVANQNFSSGSVSGAAAGSREVLIPERVAQLFTDGAFNPASDIR